MNATAPREKLLNHSCQAVLLRGVGGLLMVNAIGGVDGRPAGEAIEIGVIRLHTYVWIPYDYANYEFSNNRYQLKKQMTINVFNDFKRHVEKYGNCRCRRAFGVDN